MSRTDLITSVKHSHWRASCLFSAWIHTTALSGSTTCLFGPLPPRLSLLSRIPPLQVVWNWAASPLHPLHYFSRLIPAALTTMFSSGQEVRKGERWAGSDGPYRPVTDGLAGSSGGFRCQQNEETEKGGRRCLGCRSGRQSRDVAGCCLVFLYFY